MADPTPADRTAPQPVPLVPLSDRERLGAPLPAPLTSFVGREREAEQIADLLRRPDVRVQSRSGYFALPSGEAATFPFEVDLLRALRSYPLPSECGVRVHSFRFGAEPGGVRHTAVLELPLAGIRFEPSDGDTDRAHFSMLLVIRDPTGLVVEKFSEDAPLLLHLDGELREPGVRECTVEVVPARLTVLMAR